MGPGLTVTLWLGVWGGGGGRQFFMENVMLPVSKTI